MLFSQLPKPDYLKRLAGDLATLGANSLLMEYVDRFPYRKHPDVVNPEAFTVESLSEFIAYAQSLGLEIVPLVQSFAHVEHILKLEAYRGLSEIPTTPKQWQSTIPNQWQYCPQREEAFDFLMDCYEELFEMHPNSKYLHLGCDERR